jgi:hypothetical protein
MLGFGIALDKVDVWLQTQPGISSYIRWTVGSIHISYFASCNGGLYDTCGHNRLCAKCKEDESKIFSMFSRVLYMVYVFRRSCAIGFSLICVLIRA